MRRIASIRRGAVLYCLSFEWAALPLGAGGSIGSLTNLSVALDGHGLRQFIAIFFIAAFLLLLAIGLWRPAHRRLGLRRGEWVPSA